MKTILLIPLLFSICSCYGGEGIIEKEIEYEYSDVSEKLITYDDIFSFKGDYFVYFYRNQCQYCLSIKQDVIAFALERNDFYFLEYIDEKHVSSNDVIKKNIGATSLEELAIVGTPTLIAISNHEVIDNIAGANSIVTYIETLSHSKLETIEEKERWKKQVSKYSRY